MNYLPGWQPGLLTADQATITFITSAVASGVGQITAPSGIQAGDLLIIYHAGDRGPGNPAAVTPAGFTLAITTTANWGKFFTRASLHYKVATGAESGVIFNTILGDDLINPVDDRAIFLVFRLSTVATSIVIGDVEGFSPTSIPFTRNILSGAGIAPLIAFTGFLINSNQDGAAVTDCTLSPIPDNRISTASNSNDLSAVWKIYNSAPINVDATGPGAPCYNVSNMYFEMHA